MRKRLSTALAAFACVVAVPAASQDWTPVERVDAYAVSGSTGIELYESIGRNGPKVGIGRAIAFTDFELLWSRDYRPQPDGSCVLASARPSLVITYRLPELSGDLPAATRRLWDTFIDGVRAHEKVHGEFIIDMVRKIEATSIGLTAADDPGCKKVRQELQRRLGALSAEQQQKSRSFDRTEMSEGGNVHQLVLALVNG